MPDFTDNLRPRQPDGPTTLAQERTQSNLSVVEVSKHLFAEEGFIERQARVLPVLQNESLFDKTQQQNLSRPDRFKLALARAKLLRRLADQHKWSVDDYKMAEYLLDEVSPYYLHLHMFITTMREQGSDAQQVYWMPLIESFNIIGAYAQTELGHGSNVQGLELEARWDPPSKEFILHSPSLTASKWWNGSLGRTANHAIVVAQLLLPEPGTSKYVSHGTHSFIVQVRDMKTHQPLDGVVVGDIGPKYGYGTIDNAYMLFHQFRVPHSALLSRYSEVDPETGIHKKTAPPVVVYGTMTYVRALIVHQARLALARAVTIAVRYTSIRKQFPDRDGDKKGPELSVLDYPTVQIRLFPLLATTFVCHYTGHAMQKIYKNARKDIERGDFRSLAYMHALSSGLKSYCTNLVADGIETCRRALGGHGYGGPSGFIQLSNDYVSRVTVEGDNWMITQQVASFLIKKMTTAVSSVNQPPVDEIDRHFGEFFEAKQNGRSLGPFDILTCDQAIVKAFQLRATAFAYSVYTERVTNKKSWNSMLVQLHKLSEAQSQTILVSIFYSAVHSDQSHSQALKSALKDLYRLFALYTMQTDGYGFFRCGAVSQEQLDTLPAVIQGLMTRIRPHAVNLVDSWKIPDYLLDSALGRFDGRVYEDLFNRAHRLNPLNQITVNPNYWEDEIVKGSGDDWSSMLAKL